MASNTIRQLYDAKELYFAEDGANQLWVTVPKLVKAGYASHSLDTATQHNIGPWGTTGLRSIWIKPGKAVKISEVFDSGKGITYGRTMSYPDEQ